jgi:hypothetical protein
MGLGNRLFPWARCHLHATRNHVPMLAPHWWWPPRVRPLLTERPPAAELPGHLYVRGMRALPEYIAGPRRIVIEATSRGSIRVFRGEAGRFTDLHDAQDELGQALQRICTVSWPRATDCIGLHVRRGDFSLRARTPDNWFVDALRAVRAHVGALVPARIVSDSSESALQTILREPDTTLVRTGAPLGDLLALAGARVLLASGSSFSAWAAFLGGMPAATQSHHSLAWYGVPARSFLGHFNPDEQTGGFLQAAAAAF